MVNKKSFRQEVKGILQSIKSLQPDLDKIQSNNKTCFLDNGNVLTLPRTNGDSRYVYGDNGFNFWVHASGYMYANNGLFSIFNRRKEGDEPVIAFFLGLHDNQTNNQFKPISLLPVPVLDDPEPLVKRRFTVFNQHTAYFFVELDRLLAIVRVFVDGDNRMVFSLMLENKGTSELPLYTSSYFRPFCRHQISETDEDRWFSEVRLDETLHEDGMFSAALVEVGEDLDRFHSESYFALVRGKYTGEGEISIERRHANTSRLNFVGDYKRNLSSSLALDNGKFRLGTPLTTFADIAVVSDINHFSVGVNSYLRLDYVFEVASDHTARKNIALQPIDCETIDEKIIEGFKKNEIKLSSLKAGIEKFNNSLTIDAHDFNQFLTHLKYQVSFCGLIKGYIQLHPRSLIGIRDVFQALEGMQYYQPEESRGKMLEALSFTTLSGRCLRQYSLPAKGAESGTADVRQFIDQGVWVITAIHSYLQLTGDEKFLTTQAGYHEIIDEVAHAIAPCDKQDSVLEHLFRIMNYLDQNRDHKKTKLLRALYGDWNDALDGLGIAKDPEKEYGTGVSVMATLQFFQNCEEMIAILEKFYPTKHSDKINHYKKIRDEISLGLLKYAVIDKPGKGKKILHGWGDERSYLVGSNCDPDQVERDGLTSNAFWVISKMLVESPELELHILQAFNRLDSKYGLKTFHPPFPKGTPGVGRIPKLPPGTAENGATYIHATLFGVMALFLMGKAKEAWAQIEKVLPFTSIHKNYTHSPFVMPNSYVHNPELGLDGESMNDWQTGSSNVLLKILIWYVFGYKPEFDGLRLQVAAWTPFDHFWFESRLRGKSIKLSYMKKKNKSGKREFFVNGKGPYEGKSCPKMRTVIYFIPYQDMDEINAIEIVDSK